MNDSAMTVASTGRIRRQKAAGRRDMLRFPARCDRLTNRAPTGMLDGPVALHQRAEKHAPTAIDAYAASRTGECSAVYGEAFFCVLTASRMPIPGFLALLCRYFNQ